MSSILLSLRFAVLTVSATLIVYEISSAMVADAESWTTDSTLEEELLVPTSIGLTTVVSGTTITLGAALDAFDNRLKAAGVNVVLSRPTGIGGDNRYLSTMTSQRVLLCSTNIKMAISQAFLYLEDQFSTRSVGARSRDARKTLVPGNVVALYSPSKNAFVRISEGSADYKGGKRSPDELPLSWGSERFLVVDGGRPGTIALWSPSHFRFLCMRNDGNFFASQAQVTREFDTPRTSETVDFVSKPSIEKGEVILSKSSTPDCVGKKFRVIQIGGFNFSEYSEKYDSDSGEKDSCLLAAS